MSPKYTLNKEDGIKILSAFAYSMAAAVLTFSVTIVQEIDFGEYTFLVPVINTVLYTLIKWVEGQ